MFPSTSRKEITIMTVEPGESSLSTRKLLIESAGFNCISAVSAGQCLRLLDKHTVEAVLLDVDIEDMDPSELISRISDKQPDLPFFALAHNGWVPDTLKNRFLNVFEKMADPKHLTEELTHFFARLTT